MKVTLSAIAILFFTSFDIVICGCNGPSNIDYLQCNLGGTSGQSGGAFVRYSFVNAYKQYSTSIEKTIGFWESTKKQCSKDGVVCWDIEVFGKNGRGMTVTYAGKTKNIGKSCELVKGVEYNGRKDCTINKWSLDLKNWY